ncbi:MAG: nucleotide sugar dehydrogenase [Candidatus Kapaibacterium sp.]
MKEEIIEKIRSRNITAGIIGLGYVGLPLAVEFGEKMINTIGFDVSGEKVAMLQSGANYIKDIADYRVENIVKEGVFVATTDFSRLKDCDVIFICVPTPFTINKDPDISYIMDASRNVAENLQRGQVIILKSTTFPGTTEKYVMPELEKSGLKAGEDFYLAFSPERIDPGNKVWNTANTPIVVGGINEISTELAVKYHNMVVDKIVPVTSPKVAEMEKLLENIFRSVNIALVNELAQLCDRIGINVWEVVEAASTKPFGYMPFYPGPGIGGHCILIDPYYLAWMAREYDFVTKFIQLAAEVNEDMPFYVKSMIIKEIAKQPIALDDAKILMLGVAFKKDVDDLRHSPALKVMEFLMAEKITNISYYDPYIPEIEINGRKFYSEKDMTKDLLKEHDVIVITTDHTVFDMDMIVRNSKAIVDTRNSCKTADGDKSNVTLLGNGNLYI